MAFLANWSILTNHWVDKRGSTTTPVRSECPTECTRFSILTRAPSSCNLATVALRASKRSIPANSPANSFIVPSSFITLTCGRLWRCPTRKSLGSWAGVIFTTPVPNSGSACSSATIGINLLTIGRITFLPIKSL